jgi:hypothetical protein
MALWLASTSSSGDYLYRFEEEVSNQFLDHFHIDAVSNELIFRLPGRSLWPGEGLCLDKAVNGIESEYSQQFRRGKVTELERVQKLDCLRIAFGLSCKELIKYFGCLL